jgi:opacity protein-like surface antigen
MKVLLTAAVAALFAIPAAASAAVVPVTSLSGDFGATNSTVTLTADGVHFGTYADGGAIGGTLTYNGFNGHTLAELADFSYTFSYRASDNTTGAAPYARVFIDADPAVDTPSTGDPGLDAFLGYNDGVPNNDIDHDIVLDPSMTGATPAPGGTCPAVEPAQATDLTFSMATHLVRFDDDPGAACATSVMTFADAKAAAGPTATISALLVSQGNSTGHDVSALLRQITVNGTTFVFGAPQSGPAGPAGPAGGTVTIVQQPTQLTQTTVASSRLVGNTLRVLHAPKRKGERLLSVRAWLLTPTGAKRLPVDGRAIKVDLRRKPVGNYNVILKSKYRRKDGTVHTVRTTRNLSITPVA